MDDASTGRTDEVSIQPPGGSEVARIVAALAREIQPRRVILFGSAARGAAGPESDLDLLVVAEMGEEGVEASVKVRRAARSSGVHRPMDIFVLTPEEFQARVAGGDPVLADILSSGVEVYAA